MTAIMQSIDPMFYIIVLSIIFFLIGGVVYKVKSRDDDLWIYDNLSEDEQTFVDVLENNEENTKQKYISDQLDWSDAKTSRVTSSLVEKNVIKKERNERLNYVNLLSQNRKEPTNS